jgi:surface antigen
MSTATAAYAFGNCTYYVATRYPTIYPYLGDAAQWVQNASKQGYPVLGKPAADTVVVYGPGNGYSALGHVAVVESVNSDGSFQVSEMNYAGYDVVDNRRSTMKGVIGFIVPPGSNYTSNTQAALYAAQSASGSSKCVVGGPSIFGATICMDGAVGFGAMAAGGLLMIAGIIVFAAFALKQSGVVDKVAGSVGPLAGPWGAVASLAVRTSTPKAKPVAPSPEEGKAASDARMAVAKSRLHGSYSDDEIETAKSGENPRKRAETHAPGVGYSEQQRSKVA